MIETAALVVDVLILVFLIASDHRDHKPRRAPSILRDILVDLDQLDPTAEQLRAAAIRVHRAKLTHLVGEASPLEVQALADAGDLLEHEYRLRLVSALLNPAESFKVVDGGAMARRQAMAAAESEAGS